MGRRYGVDNRVDNTNMENQIINFEKDGEYSIRALRC